MPAVAAWDVLAVQLYLGAGVRPLTMLMVGALALFVYALNGLSDAAEDSVNDALRAATLRSHAFWTLGSATLALLGAGYELWRRGQLHAVYPLWMALGVAYSFRIVPWPSQRGLQWRRLKDVLLLKNLVIGATWAGAVFVAPLLDAPVTPARRGVLALVGVSYCALVVVNSVYCDMRDEAGDRQANVTTLPVKFGAARCHRGIFIAMSAWTALLLSCFTFQLIDGPHCLLLSASALAYPLSVWLATERWRIGRTASNYLIESADLLFALGLITLTL